MNKTWYEISSSLGLFKNIEANIHPHAPEERSELFHASDAGGTEWEYLNLLHALVLAMKPTLILETGTENGFGTLALASAVSENGVGAVVSVDVSECAQARVRVRDFGLSSFVRFVQAEAFAHCATTDDIYDFGFFDSDVGCRHRECSVLLRRKRISGLAAFHDASPLRFAYGSNFDMVEWVEGHQHILFPLSRGLALVKL